MLIFLVQMTRLKPIAFLAISALIASGAAARPRPPVTDWHELARPDDRKRLRGWRDGWIAALARANVAHAAEVRSEGPLLVPDAALSGVRPPAGAYRCRSIRLGARSPGGVDWAERPPGDCRITDDGVLLGFAGLDGVQRPIGRLYPDSASRLVFLGTMMLADEKRPLDYGRDDERDLIGAFERVGERRWRLVLPWPRWQSMMEVIELVPAG